VLVVLAACRGYRAPGDSEPLRRDIEDRLTATRVRVALGEDPQTAPYDAIRVRCVEGTVYLEGRVDRPAVRRRAEAIAASCAGVRSVKTKITVASSE